MDEIEIRDESGYKNDKLVVRHTLYVSGEPKASVVMAEGGVSMNWGVYGPQYWPQAQVVLQGLLELSVLADQLSHGSKIVSNEATEAV